VGIRETLESRSCKIALRPGQLVTEDGRTSRHKRAYFTPYQIDPGSTPVFRRLRALWWLIFTPRTVLAQCAPAPKTSGEGQRRGLKPEWAVLGVPLERRPVFWGKNRARTWKGPFSEQTPFPGRGPGAWPMRRALPSDNQSENHRRRFVGRASIIPTYRHWPATKA